MISKLTLLHYTKFDYNFNNDIEFNKLSLGISKYFNYDVLKAGFTFGFMTSNISRVNDSTSYLAPYDLSDPYKAVYIERTYLFDNQVQRVNTFFQYMFEKKINDFYFSFEGMVFNPINILIDDKSELYFFNLNAYYQIFDSFFVSAGYRLGDSNVLLMPFDNELRVSLVYGIGPF